MNDARRVCGFRPPNNAVHDILVNAFDVISIYRIRAENIGDNPKIKKINETILWPRKYADKV